MITRKLVGALTAAAIWVVALVGIATVDAPAGWAMGDEPDTPKIDCRKKKNKKKKQCKKRQKSGLTDVERYQAGYWLAKSGKYAAALDQFRKISNQDDPRVLNYIGFTTRKLGRLDEAMGYYRKVLAIDPNYTLARAYMAEALLTQGRVDAASRQLGEIGRRCGRQCEEYVALARQIESFKVSGRFDPQGGQVLPEQARN